MPPSDWSQFIPELISGLLTAILLGIFAYLISDKFKRWVKKLPNRIINIQKWLTARWYFILPHSLVIVLAIIFRIYTDWRIVIFSLTCYIVGWLSLRLSAGYPLAFGKKKSMKAKSEYLPVSLVSGAGNSHIKNYYIDPPYGDILLGEAQFRLDPNALIFDTNKQHTHTLLADGKLVIDFLKLSKPQNHIESVYLLINSSNSKSIYAHQSIGEIKLVFKDAPPIVVELILGANIREWCLGNPGDFVREASSPMLMMGMWKGLSKNGANAVIDCLQIPVYECMKGCFLEKITLVHKPLKHPSDTLGVHFSIYAVSLKITQDV